MGAIVQENNLPGFALRRSYCPALCIQSTFAVEPIWDGQTIVWTSAPGYIYRLAITDRFYAWSSNSYTLDYILDLPGSSIDCIFFPCFDQVNLGFGRNINDDRPLPFFRTFATSGQSRVMNLPPPPSDYWLPGWF